MLNPVLACWAVALTLLAVLSARKYLPAYDLRVLVAFSSAMTILALLVGYYW